MVWDEREKWLCTLSTAAGESDKNWLIAFCLSFGFGYFGADRFYLNSLWLGLFKLFTLGGLGVWYAIDIVILLMGRMRDADGGLVTRPF